MRSLIFQYKNSQKNYLRETRLTFFEFFSHTFQSLIWVPSIRKCVEAILPLEHHFNELSCSGIASMDFTQL